MNNNNALGKTVKKFALAHVGMVFLCRVSLTLYWLDHSMAILSIDDFGKRWKNSKVTTFNIEHTWTIDQFDDQFVGRHKEIEPPVFSADGHDIQFQLAFELVEKNSCENLWTKVIVFHLHFYPGIKIVSEVPVSFTLTFYSENDVLLHKSKFQFKLKNNSKTNVFKT